MSTIISELLEYIHKYYSIGIPGLLNYQGQSALESILEKKINSLDSEEQTPWFALIKSLREVFEGYELQDCGFLQFPNYVCYIVMDNQRSENVNMKTRLVCALSLLCDYYTIFFEDIYTMERYELVYPSEAPGLAVVSFEGHPAFKTHSKEITELKSLIATKFPGYSYLHHKPLFKTPIAAGIPHGEGPSEVPVSYSIYRYLFNSYSYFVPFEVLD